MKLLGLLLIICPVIFIVRFFMRQPYTVSYAGYDWKLVVYVLASVIIQMIGLAMLVV